ncbi:MAG: hypothetical protein R6T91_10200 [Bacteroidales bacterium]
MIKKIINPFRYISGWPALLTGIVGLLAMTGISTVTNTHLDGVLDVHYASTGDLWVLAKENAFTWFSLMLVFGLTGLILRGPTFRFLDLAGYTAFFRLPLIIAVLLPLFLDGSKVADYIIHELMHTGEAIELTTGDIIGFILLTLLTILIIFWSLLWGYLAFKSLFNIHGLKAAALFFVVILLAELLVKILLFLTGGFDTFMNIPT